MIFKHLFRSKHQNPDPQVRIQAIEKLNKEDSEQKSVLHELAFNDSDINVSLAALQKLDSFVLWYKMAEIAKSDRVQKKSQQYVEKALLDENNQILVADEKRKFILELRDIRLIDKLLAQKWLQQDTELAMSLLAKVDKPQLQEKLLFDTQNENLQKAILNTLVDGLSERKLLNKVIKKCDSDTVKEQANTLLSTWLQDEQAPLEVEQQTKMILSRLLALKDHSDFLHIEQKQTELKSEYKRCFERFDCLAEIKRVEIEQKFADITTRVERTIALLKPIWLAEQAEQVLNQNIEALVTEAEQSLIQLSEQLATRISEIELSEIDVFKQKITLHIEQTRKLTAELSAGNRIAHKRLEQLNNRLLSSLSTLTSLPEFQQTIQLAQALVEKFAALSVPTDVSQIEAAEEYLREQKQLWRESVSGYQAHLPASLSKQWDKGLKLWLQAVKSLKSQSNAELTRCRNKLRAVESLVNQGKFKAAMGLYEKVQRWFKALPEKQQGQLERTFISVKEQIENLKDWQDYIAAPRKPALLNEVDALIAQPLAIEAQSNAIKSLRYQWNSLGKIDSESDKALNEAFESAIEKAFAPCRAFYDQQQQQREQNMLAKQQLLAEIKALGERDGNMTELAKTLRNVQQKWKSIGEVDFKQRNALYESYQKLLNPLRDKVSAFYQDNAEQKQALLNKATKLLELESVADGIEQAKKLQEMWKTIEHAGKKAEAELWPAFRKVNDSLFAKRNAQSNEQKSQLKLQISAVNEQVAQLQTSLEDASDKSSIQNALHNKESVIEAINALPVSHQRGLEQKIQRLVEQQQSKLSDLGKAAKRQQYHDLFATLKLWQNDTDISANVAMLSKQWQQCFDGDKLDIDRHELTIKMEIVAQKDSPEEDASTRKSIQMQLMAQKLQSGDSLDLLVLLKDWIRVGSLNDNDVKLLSRVEPLYAK